MSNRKPVFFTSDWHIGHANSIGFDNRPFRDVNHMHEVLIANYNNDVPTDGVCYFLGDVGVTNTEVVKKVIERLNGTKVLILGNHDKQHSAMYNCGFDVVLNGAVLYIQNERVTMSHCPLIGLWREDLSHLPAHKQKDPPENWHGETKAKAEHFAFHNEGQFHLHGHIHSRKDTKEIKPTTLGKQFDVGVPAHNYRPVHIGIIEGFIMRNRGSTLDKTRTKE